MARYLEDIVAEAHVEHTVGLVEYEETHLAQVYVAHTDMADETAGSGYHYVSTHSETLHLLVVAVTVVAAIHRHTADAVEIIAKALHGLVYLLGQFPRGRHDDAVDGFFGIAAIVQHAEDGQQVGGRLARSGLGHADDVVIVENLRDATLLDRGAIIETHVVERIEDIVIQISVFKFHVDGIFCGF